MKTRLHSEENSQANYSGYAYIRKQISTCLFLLLFFTLSSSLNMIVNAQPLNNDTDIVLVNHKEVITPDSMEESEYEASESKETYAIAVTSSLTGSGQGMYYAPFLVFHAKIGFFALGPTIQKEKMNFSGFQLNYELNLLGKNTIDSNYFRRMELFGFFNGSYQFNAMLSEASQRNELPAFQMNPNPTLLRVFEGYGGIGMRVELFSNFKWFNCIGFGGYKLLDAPETLIHDKQGMGLFLRTGISYEFDKENRISRH